MLGNVSEAEDMTQEAFLHLFRKIGSFRGEIRFLHMAASTYRQFGPDASAQKGPATSSPSKRPSTRPKRTRPKRDFGSRDLQLTGSVDRVALERAVASLPPGYRMVFVLHDVEGFEHNEIATMLECSTGNSKSQLHKARLKLRELLRDPEPTKLADLKEAAL